MRIKRRFKLWSLFDDGYYSGTKLQPDKFKFTYEYKDGVDDLDFATVYVIGIEPDKTTPTVLASFYDLPKSACPAEKTMATVIELQNVTNVVDMFCIVTGINYLEEFHFASAVFDISQIKHGVEADYDDIECGLFLRTFTLNNGEIFSWDNIVNLNHTFSGDTPTHYRVSRYEDFADTDWQVYTAVPTTELYAIGPNTFYFQLKNDSEESGILSSSIGWHGALWVLYTDEAGLELIEHTAADTVSSLLGLPHLTPVPIDTADLSLLDLTDSDSFAYTSMLITSPATPVSWAAGSQTATWSYEGHTGTELVDLIMYQSIVEEFTFATGVTLSDGTVNGTIPAGKTGVYYLQIRLQSDPTVQYAVSAAITMI